MLRGDWGSEYKTNFSTKINDLRDGPRRSFEGHGRRVTKSTWRQSQRRTLLNPEQRRETRDNALLGRRRRINCVDCSQGESRLLPVRDAVLYLLNRLVKSSVTKWVVKTLKSLYFSWPCGRRSRLRPTQPRRTRSVDPSYSRRSRPKLDALWTLHAGGPYRSRTQTSRSLPLRGRTLPDPLKRSPPGVRHDRRARSVPSSPRPRP